MAAPDDSLEQLSADIHLLGDILGRPLLNAVFLTINGIAAGLKNTG